MELIRDNMKFGGLVELDKTYKMSHISNFFNDGFLNNRRSKFKILAFFQKFIVGFKIGVERCGLRHRTRNEM